MKNRIILICLLFGIVIMSIGILISRSKINNNNEFTRSEIPIKFARSEIPKSPDPFTPEMREAYGQFYKIHSRMDKKIISATLDQLFEEFRRHNPRVFVPMVIVHLMRIAPKDKRTIYVLHRSLQDGWIEASYAHAYLVQAGEPPDEHIKYLIKELDNSHTEQRIAAIGALIMCGALAKSALPSLYRIVEQANAPKDAYRRAYTSINTMPEHVHAKSAIGIIKHDMNNK